MCRGIPILLILWLALASPWASANGHKPAGIAVGYPEQWPTPALFLLEKNTFDRSLGLAVDWRSYPDSAAMREALAAGEIQIAYALDFESFLVGASGAAELAMIGVAVEYGEADNCILRRGSPLEPGGTAELAGIRAAVRDGGLSHFRLLKMLEHLGIDAGAVEIIAVDSDTAAAAALYGGAAVIACASGSGLRAMEGLGRPLMTASEQAAIGLRVFDTVAVSSAFVEQHADVLQDFMDVLEAANQQWRLSADVMLPAIARAADMSPAAAERALSEFSFPGAAEQMSPAWLGAQLVVYSKEVADFLVARGRLDRALDDYDTRISTRFLR